MFQSNITILLCWTETNNFIIVFPFYNTTGFLQKKIMICTHHKILFWWSNQEQWDAKTCSTYGERRSVHKILVVKPEGKRPLGRSRRRWKDNIKTEIYIQCRSKIDLQHCFSSSSSCSWRVRHVSLFLDPQDEGGPSISSSVVLCFFVRLVCILVLVLVICLCPSFVHVLATFPGTVLFPVLCSVLQFFV